MLGTIGYRNKFAHNYLSEMMSALAADNAYLCITENSSYLYSHHNSSYSL